MVAAEHILGDQGPRDPSACGTAVRLQYGSEIMSHKKAVSSNRRRFLIDAEQANLYFVCVVLLIRSVHSRCICQYIGSTYYCIIARSMKIETMKASRYNIVTRQVESGKMIIFNALYGSMMVFSEMESPIVTELLEDPALEVLGSMPSSIWAQLVAGKYIVDDSLDELSIIKNRKRKGMIDHNRLDVIVMPNMACNFSCPYCYESHESSCHMEDATEDSIKKWLKREIPRYKVVLLNWFGGEPLLSYKRIISIGSFVKSVSEEHRVGFMTNVTTNGYLFNQQIISSFLKAGIFSYQITVDGPPDTHNKTRVLKSGRGTFNRIFNNIVCLTKSDLRVKISIRINFNHNNLHSIPKLLEMFPEDIRHQLRVVYEPIFGKEELCATSGISNEEISVSITKYYKLAKTMGYDVTLGNMGTGKLVYCYAERERQFIINYNGDIFKCSVCRFDPSERIGYLNDTGEIILDEKSWNTWFGMELFDKRCYQCKFLPLCMGGCRKDRLERGRTGSFCSLLPTNTSFLLKSIAFDNFNEILRSHCSRRTYVAENENHYLSKLTYERR
jgi:uncharacterized protein